MVIRVEVYKNHQLNENIWILIKILLICVPNKNNFNDGSAKPQLQSYMDEESDATGKCKCY